MYDAKNGEHTKHHEIPTARQNQRYNTAGWHWIIQTL